MKRILSGSLLILGILAVFAIGGFLLVLLAYGIGWILTRFLPFSNFEATLLSLIGLCALGMTVVRSLISAITSAPPILQAPEDEEEWEDEDEEWEDEDEEELDDIIPDLVEPVRPNVRGRPSRSSIDFSNVRPDDRCPCGSGRKYKNCHGRGLKYQPRSNP